LEEAVGAGEEGELAADPGGFAEAVRLTGGGRGQDCRQQLLAVATGG